MTRLVTLVALVALVVPVAPAGVLDSLFFDFGETTQPTPGNYNNISQSQLPIFNAINASGVGTGISLQVTDEFWPGSNQNGTLTPAGAGAQFHPQATRDNLFGNTATFGGFLEPTAQLTLGGLVADGTRTYTFTFFASRMGVTDNREAQYAVSGLNAGVGYLDASNNTSNVAIVAGIIPTANGQVTINISPGPNNNNASGFYYLGAMRLDVVPEPAAVVLALLGAALARSRRA